MSRRFATLLLAVVAATGLLATPAGTAEVRAAAPNLTIVTDARYEVQPDAHRVRITVDMTLVNHLRDTATKRYFFDRALLSVLPGTSGYKLTWAGAGSPKVTVSKRTDDYTLLQLGLAQRLYSGKSAKYQLVFDLVDPGGAAARDIRIGPSLVSFPVWAFATNSTGGSTVQVTFPKGFEVQVQSGAMPAPTTASDGRVVLTTGKLAKPLTFFAFLVADRPADLVTTSLTVGVGDTPVDLKIEAWPDDASWSKRVGGLVTKALPVLSTRIGLAWPRDGGLVIREAVSRSTGGYAGLFDPVGRRGRGRLLRRRRGRPPRGGARLVQRVAARGPLGQRGLRVLLRPRDGGRPQGEGRDRGADRQGQDRPGSRSTPGARSAPRTRRPRPTATRRRWSLPVRSRSVPATRRSRRSGPTRLAVSARTSRPPPPPSGQSSSKGQSTGVGCSTSSRHTGPRRTTTCGGRGWLGTRTSRSSTRGPRRGHATTPS